MGNLKADMSLSFHVVMLYKQAGPSFVSEGLLDCTRPFPEEVELFHASISLVPRLFCVGGDAYAKVPSIIYST